MILKMLWKYYSLIYEEIYQFQSIFVQKQKYLFLVQDILFIRQNTNIEITWSENFEELFIFNEKIDNLAMYAV